MIHIPINIATEDELSEAVLKRLLEHTKRNYSIGTAFRRGGYGFLKRRIEGWNRAAASTPVIILTDLDMAPCPAQLINSWLKHPVHPNLIMRIAVREVESWLLADSEGLAAYLGIKINSCPEHPDELQDPKAKLVALAQTSRSREIKSRIVPKANSTAKQGPDYNSCLRTFVAESWDVSFASKRSPSLLRAIERFTEFNPTWEQTF